ncbi:MAG: hypothetical protein ABII90_02375 [Bacteroidota bacterium]
MQKKFSYRKKTYIKVVILLSFIILFCVIYEVALRIKGIQPFQPKIHNIIYEPEFIFAPSSTLGYTLKPGKFKFTMCDLDSLTFNPVHNNDSLRITRALQSEKKYISKEKVYIYGASFTYGFGIEDSLTYPYLLQKAYPHLNFVNFSVPGYGTIHALLLLKRAVMYNEIPSVVVINYSFYHDDTNTLPRKTRETILRFSNMLNENFIKKSSFPYADIDHGGKLMIDYIPCGSFYTEWLLRRYSAFINFLEMKYNETEGKFYDNHMVSKKIINEIHKLCLKNNITLVVAGINNADLTREMLAYCDTLGILNSDISVDLSAESKFRLHPKDGHPNAPAHAEFANKYIKFFRENSLLNDDENE